MTINNVFLTNDLVAPLNIIWEMLIAGANNRRSPLHMPSVATISTNGFPSQRIMVLREADQHNRILRFHTDVRSTKNKEIQNGAHVSILGYDPEVKVQIRLWGNARIETKSQLANSAWEATSLYGRRCYLAEPGPGTIINTATSGLAKEIEGQKPTLSETEFARENFAILMIEIVKVEWLYLAHTGHRRAQYVWNYGTNDWDGNWMIP